MLPGLDRVELSLRQIVLPEIEATMADSTATRARSGHCQRASGWAGLRRHFAGQRLDRDHDLRGEVGGLPPRGKSVRPPDAASKKRLRHLETTCRGRVQAGGDLVVAETVGRVSTIRARTTSEYGDVYQRARAWSSARSASANVMLYGLVRGMLLPSSRNYVM